MHISIIYLSDCTCSICNFFIFAGCKHPYRVAAVIAFLPFLDSLFRQLFIKSNRLCLELMIKTYLATV